MSSIRSKARFALLGAVGFAVTTLAPESPIQAEEPTLFQALQFEADLEEDGQVAPVGHNAFSPTIFNEPAEADAEASDMVPREDYEALMERIGSLEESWKK